MRKLVCALLLLSSLGGAEPPASKSSRRLPPPPPGGLDPLPRRKDPLPQPPPVTPQSLPGQPAPFNPNETREAVPQPPIQLPALPGPAEKELSLEELVDIALSQQPDVVAARADLLRLEGTTEVQRARLLPSVGGSSTFTHSSVTAPGQLAAGRPATVITTRDTLSTNLGVSQLLWDFGFTRDLVRQADLRKQAAAAAVLQAENDLALQVKESYYVYLQAQRQLRVREGDLANRQQQLKLARALYQAGNMSPGDVVRSQTTVSNSVVALNNARQALELARQQLVQSLGLSPLTVLPVVESSEPDLPQKDGLYLTGQAVKLRPDMLVAERTVAAGQAGLDSAHKTNYPALSTFAGVTYQGDSNGRQYPSLSVQLSLDFNLYDGGQRAGAVKTAQGTLQAAEADLLRTRLAVEREVATVLMQLLTAERNLEASKAGVDSAREGIRIAEGRYQAALGTLTDVFDAQSAFVSAQTNYVSSITELDLARSRLRHALAAPFEEGYRALTPPEPEPVQRNPENREQSSPRNPAP